MMAPEKYRITQGQLASDKSYGNNGAFFVPLANGQKVFVIASDGAGWDHVSVSRQDRVPTWDEMCQVKNLFFSEDEVVIQYHPRKRDYVNFHERCLHLWRPTSVELPTPPTWMVGPS